MPESPDDPVDAVVLASRDAELKRSYSLDDLPRVAAAGAGSGTVVSVRFHFSEADGGIGVDTYLSGRVVLICQRCLRPVEQPIESDSSLVLVDKEPGEEEISGGREPVVADAERLDLTWLAEEETLLALPLVPMHEMACDAVVEVKTDDATGHSPQGERHRPFENLRDLLKKR